MRRTRAPYRAALTDRLDSLTRERVHAIERGDRLRGWATRALAFVVWALVTCGAGWLAACWVSRVS